MTGIVFSLVLLSAVAFAQEQIPRGTIIPAQLSSSLNSRRSNSGHKITARIMQDVTLPNGKKIPARAKLVGRVEAVSSRRAGHEAEITVRFDRIDFHHQSLVLNAHLRAIASMMDVEDAQTPTIGPDRGTPWAWINRNLIGGEVAYGDGGPVARGTTTVGKALQNGAMMPVEANPAAGCPTQTGDNGAPQAFWVFSSDACGVYDLDQVRISHAGRTDPIGAFSLISRDKDFDIRSGSGILLRAN